MCGICGIYHADGSPVSPELLRRMNTTLAHRGPDDEGYHLESDIGLGHRRLSIIDLSTGRQPIYNEDESQVVIFNGEIYNFQELREILEGRGHQFRTRTDTEVILHGYEEWGSDCLQRFRGMFAFAVWDRKKRSLFLGRDRLGIKPLYYAVLGTRLLFASELKAILEDPAVPKTLDLEAVSDFLSFGYIPAPKTIFSAIRKLPAGHFLLHSAQGARVRQYWDLSFKQTETRNEEEICDKLLSILEESVRMRLVSDVPLGAFLSGGIDSSLVVALMSGMMPEPVNTNSVGFTVREFNELEHAQRTSELFHTSHHEYLVTPDAVEVMRQLSWFYDEPFADSSSIPTYYVSKMTRQQVTVALSGDGGDENFAGYRRYYFDSLENRVRNLLPASFRRQVIGPLARLYPKADRLPQIFRAKTLLTNLATDPVSGYFRSMSYFLPEMKQKILSPAMQESLKDYDSIEVFRQHYNRCDSADPLSRVQYLDFKTYLVDDILTKVDRASMANALEVRVPLLDHKFVEFAASLPSSLKLHGKISKYILKKAAGRLLPREILHRRKMGFSIPAGSWLRKELQPLVQETLLSKSFAERALFDAKYLLWMWEQHQSGARDFTQPLWALLSFEMWARRFLP